ncbi:hypothetical protein PIB30_057553 [Stylosanthes scabra]|uniref:Uncharacterized protein n=1 Tax=Stylosanthes scabra TaxID=79078 RepID=A0ABU6XKF4_9FABA|nr:hypothetical protein [Stylosanthes scabra]
MAKKKSCQNIHNPRVLLEAERELYGWVDENIFSQYSVITVDMLPGLRRDISLTEGRIYEEDYILEAAGPSDRLPFRMGENRARFLWVYQEMFTRLGVSFPFSEFQREVMMRCRIAASQLHLNGWGFFRAFECICLHFGDGGFSIPLRSLSRSSNDIILKSFPLPVDDLFVLTTRGSPSLQSTGIRR